MLYLREQLDQAHERDRENRRIIAALTTRIPAIEAPESPEPRPDRSSPPDPGEGQEAASEQPWWRRWFGG